MEPDLSEQNGQRTHAAKRAASTTTLLFSVQSGIQGPAEPDPSKKQKQTQVRAEICGISTASDDLETTLTLSVQSRLSHTNMELSQSNQGMHARPPRGP